MRRVGRQSCAILVSLAAILAGATGCAQNDDREEALDGDAAVPSAAAAHGILQASFDTSAECTPFFDLPHDVARNADYDRRQLQAFVDAGLLSIEGERTVADPAAATGQREVVRVRRPRAS